jgi:hypothetical protein
MFVMHNVCAVDDDGMSISTIYIVPQKHLLPPLLKKPAQLYVDTDVITYFSNHLNLEKAEQFFFLKCREYKIFCKERSSSQMLNLGKSLFVLPA